LYCVCLKKSLISILVFFKKENFEHAFYESVNRKQKDKSLFSYKRANRIYWIKWVLENPNAELYKGFAFFRSVNIFQQLEKFLNDLNL
jgi:hypothetical protein